MVYEKTKEPNETGILYLKSSTLSSLPLYCDPGFITKWTLNHVN